MPEEADVLIGLAEIAVAMAGFAAVVVLFARRDSGTWMAEHADRFNGMIAHALMAVAFALLPLLLGAFTSPPLLWKVASGMLGAQVVGHAALILLLATTGARDRTLTVLGAGTIAALQAANVLGVGFDGEAPPYVIGILWHLTHAGLLFIWLIWLRGDDVQPP